MSVLSLWKPARQIFFSHSKDDKPIMVFITSPAPCDLVPPPPPPPPPLPRHQILILHD